MKPTNVLGWAAALMCCSALGADADWAVYGGEAHGTRYSTLAELTPANAASLPPMQTSPIAGGDT